MLVSADFIKSDYCYDVEVKEAIKYHDSNEKIVIPIIIRFCDWSHTPFSKLQALPKDGRPISSKIWTNEDEAFLNVINGIKDRIENSKSNILISDTDDDIKPRTQKFNIKHNFIRQKFIYLFFLITVFVSISVYYWKFHLPSIKEKLKIERVYRDFANEAIVLKIRFNSLLERTDEPYLKHESEIVNLLKDMHELFEKKRTFGAGTDLERNNALLNLVEHYKTLRTKWKEENSLNTFFAIEVKKQLNEFFDLVLESDIQKSGMKSSD